MRVHATRSARNQVIQGTLAGQRNQVIQGTLAGQRNQVIQGTLAGQRKQWAVGLTNETMAPLQNSCFDLELALDSGVHGWLCAAGEGGWGLGWMGFEDAVVVVDGS